MTSRKIQQLSDSLVTLFETKAIGHCLRVDDLPTAECLELCELLRRSKANCSTYILESASMIAGDNSAVIRIDNAIEKRNAVDSQGLKKESLCLIVPSGVTKATVDSLGNSFERFDTTIYLETLEKKLIEALPENIKPAVLKSIQQASKRVRLQLEDRVEYLDDVLRDPSVVTAGTLLYKLGLLPDKGENYDDRLTLNYDCTSALLRPQSPHSPVRMRLEATKLRKGDFLDKLEKLLLEQPLEPAKRWLKRLAEEPGFDFSNWEFPTIVESDLEAIKIKKPRRNPDGDLINGCGDLYCDGPESPIIAICGPEKKISVSWETVPKNANNVAFWQVELIPSREDYESFESSEELPQIRKQSHQKSAKLQLDFDSNELTIKWIQVKVIALDENGSEIKQEDDSPIEGISERILLQNQTVSEEPDQRQKLYTYPNLPFGLLKIAQSYYEESWSTSPQGWHEEESLHYFNLMVGDASICRIAVSNCHRTFESRILSSPDTLGRLNYSVFDIEEFNSESISDRPDSIDNIPPWLSESFDKFKEQRRKLFKTIRDQYEGTGLIETTDWDNSLIAKVRSYTETYAQLLERVRSTGEQPVELRKRILNYLLTVDTIQLEVHYTTGNEKVIVLSPTHPHRLLWMAAYAALMNEWRTRLLELTNKSERKRAINFDHLAEVTPVNIPFILPNDSNSNRDGENWFVFAKNYGFCSGLFLSVACKDWSRVTGDVLRFLGYEDEPVATDVSPTKISDIIGKFLNIHPYCSETGMRMGVVNPGDGYLLSSAFRRMLSQSLTDEDTNDSANSLSRLEVSSLSYAPLPMEIEGFERLRNEMYLTGNTSDNTTSLNPAFALSLSERGDRPAFPNGDQHISFLFDAVRPSVSLEQFEENITESISFYGLVNRWQSDSKSEYGQLKWRYWLAVNKPERYEKHPTDPKLTDGLINISRHQSWSLAFLLDSNASGENYCCLSCSIGPDERAFIEYLHQKSDWVITIDRFFGADFFDSPNDPALSQLSKKYLIDYTPDVSEGLGDRLLITTCWPDELEKIVAESLSMSNLPATEDDVLRLVNALKMLTGHYILSLIKEDEEFAGRVTGLGLLLNFLLKEAELRDALLIPTRSHPEIFLESDKMSDLLIVKFRKDEVEIECVSVQITRLEIDQEPYENSLDSIEHGLNNSEKILTDTFFTSGDDGEEKIGLPLARARIVAVMHHYLSKSIRHGLVAESSMRSKFIELLNKLEAGKIVPIISKKIFSISPFKNSPDPIRSVIDDFIFLELTHSQLEDLSTQEPAKYSLEEAGTQFVKAPNVITSIPYPKPVEESPSFDGQDETLTGPMVQHDIPDYPTNPVIPIGKTSTGQPIHWKPSVQGSPHVMIIGIPGQGKSVTINTLLIELQRKGVGTLAFDFHGQFSQIDNSFHRLCNPTVWDASEGLPFSPFEADLLKEIGQHSWKTQSFAVADIFAYVCELGDIQKDGVYQSIISCYRDSKNRGNNMLPTISDLSKKIERLESIGKIRNVSARCRPLLELNTFKPEMFNSNWDILKSTKNGLIVNLKDVGSETVQTALSAFILRKVYREILKWEESAVLKLAIVLDEAHRLAKDVTLPCIMQEARKFGVLVILASQNINHFHPNVVGNAGSKVLFRTNYPDSGKVGKLVQMRSDADPRKVIEQLTTGQAVVHTPEMKYAEKCQMLMLKP